LLARQRSRSIAFGKETRLFAPFIYINALFYQDWLGTNIGKALKKERLRFLRNMKIKGFGTKPKMKVTVKKGVRIEIRDIDLQFDHFDFFLDRHKFPKVKDTGVGEVSCKCWCYLAFEIKLDEDKNMTVDKFRANVTIDELPMGIIKCNHKKVFKTLLKMFQKKGKEGVQDEIRKKTQENIAMISDKVRKRVFLFAMPFIYI
jgi:hypothetical protein